ncbi:MAG: type II toxin-antitoxin system RelE/ParE family toxin [Eubacterium sp.]|nr:type II toxin-antitoxin system RelE/ParE family toxin [Eubacterium sp.]
MLYPRSARHIWLLQMNGTYLPKEIVKHLKQEIWELRPGHNRVFFFCFDNNTFVLLHHFRKKTRKTPRREIEQAISEMNDYLSRKGGHRELE